MTTKGKIEHIDEATDLLFKNEQAKKLWNEMVAKNCHDPYVLIIIKFARRWAKYMQFLISQGKVVSEIAKKTSYESDFNGISDFMYNCAVKYLCECWKYGDDLKKWHNSQNGDDSNCGVVNPTVMTFEPTD